MSHIPTGFNAVTPYFHVEGASGFLDFLKEAFGAEVFMDHRHEDGSVLHAEARLRGCVVEASDARPEWPAMPCAIHVYVPDADAVHAKALAAGATELHPVTDQPYGERSSGVRDAWGNAWYIATVTDMAARTDASPT